VDAVRGISEPGLSRRVRDVWNAVRHYRSETNLAHVVRAADQVRCILDTDDDEQLRVVTDRLGVEYYPPADGWTYREWLTELEKVLRSGADT
jgi:hypothetical protein